MILKNKEFFLEMSNKETYAYTFKKNHYCVIWKKKRKDSLLNGVEEIAKNIKFVKIIKNENNIKQRIR